MSLDEGTGRKRPPPLLAQRSDNKPCPWDLVENEHTDTSRRVELEAQVTWGHKEYGGDSEHVREQLHDVPWISQGKGPPFLPRHHPQSLNSSFWTNNLRSRA